MSGEPMNPQEAAAVLYRHRHRLSPDILRTIQEVWVCASAARYGEPYETWWVEDLDAYSDHDVAECEADDAGIDFHGAASVSPQTAPPVQLREQL
jgi:hypothetical protein